MKKRRTIVQLITTDLNDTPNSGIDEVTIRVLKVHARTNDTSMKEYLIVADNNGNLIVTPKKQSWTYPEGGMKHKIRERVAYYQRKYLRGL